MGTEKPERLVRASYIYERLGIHYTTLWRWIKDGKFPPPIQLGRFRAWPKEDVDRWEASQRRRVPVAVA